MTGYDATIVVNDQMAQTVAQRVLDTLGVEPDEVADISVDLRTGADGETVTSFDSSGGHAGHIAMSMIGGIDFESHPASHIRVALNTVGESDESDAESEADTETGEDSGHGFDHNQAVREAAQQAGRGVGRTREITDLATEEPNVDEPQSVNGDTRHHELLYMIDRWHGQFGREESVETTELYENAHHDFPPREAMGSSLSTLSPERALVERRKATQDHGGVKNQYRLNSHGKAQLEELGTPTVWTIFSGCLPRTSGGENPACPA